MTKLTFAIIAAAVILAAPALAAPNHRSGAAPASTGPYYPHVFVGGQDQGTDPSALVRLDLLRDPPYR